MALNRLIPLAAALALLSGCTSLSQKPSVYQVGHAQTRMQVAHGVVVAVRDVVLERRTSGTGLAAGGLIGGAALGAGERLIPGVIGALAGGIAGDYIEKIARDKVGQEVIFTFKGDHEEHALVQEKDEHPLKPGDAVRLIEHGGVLRLIAVP